MVQASRAYEEARRMIIIADSRLDGLAICHKRVVPLRTKISKANRRGQRCYLSITPTWGLAQLPSYCAVVSFSWDVLFVLMLMGGLSIVTNYVVVVRRYYFSKRINRLMVESRAGR